jgi:RNA recognition motif-containing protein
MSSSTSSSSESARSPSLPHSGQQPPKRKRQDPVDVSDSEHDSESPDETPALSHAERRRQKKKEREQKNLKSDATPATKKRKLMDGVATASSVSKKEKRQNSVWVGNLSFRTTTDALRGFFDGVGEITRVHMPMKAGANGENMGLVLPS